MAEALRRRGWRLGPWVALLMTVAVGCTLRLGEDPPASVDAAPPPNTPASVGGDASLAAPSEPVGQQDDGGVAPDAPPPGCVTPLECDDGNACTTDVCLAGRCVHGAECPTRACEIARCDPKVGCGAAERAPAGTACDDHLACTSGGRCDSNGTCVPGTPVPCPEEQDDGGTCGPIAAPPASVGSMIVWSGAIVPGGSAILEVEGLPVGTEVALVSDTGAVIGRKPAPPFGLLAMGPLPAGTYRPRAFAASGAVVASPDSSLRVAATSPASPVGLEPDLAPAVARCTGKRRCGRQVLCVRAGAASGGTGSATEPFAAVQDAIDAARDDDVVQVTEGMYTEAISIVDKSVALVGGFTTDFTARDRNAHTSTLAHPASAPATRGSTVTLLDAGRTFVTGFRITGGTGHFDGDRLFEGGGVYVSSARGDALSTPTIANNTIDYNDVRVPDAGRTGCAALPQGSACTANNECCSFACTGVVTRPDGGLGAGRCGAPDPDTWRGAGVHIDTVGARLYNNVIARNFGGRGNGVAVLGTRDARVRGNLIKDNVGASDHGGGVYLLNYTTTFVQNRVEGNEVGRGLSYGWGGGIYVGEATEDPLAPNKGSARIAYGVVTGNRAPSIGSGIFIDNGATGYIDHMLVHDNVCNAQGGIGLYVDGYDETDQWKTHAYVTASTFSEPACVAGDNVPLSTLLASNWSTIHLEDTIVAQASPDAIAVFLQKDSNAPPRITTSAVEARYSIVGKSILAESYDFFSDDEIPTQITGVGVLAVDPRFADPAAGDFALKSRTGRYNPNTGAWVLDAVSSPAIDAADPATAFTSEPAPNGGRANMGCFGGTPLASKSP